MKEALTRKIGPLPTWGWILVVLFIASGLVWWKNRQSQAAASPSNVTPPVINQFQVTPPLQEDEDNEDTDVDHPKAHRRRPHPTHHKRDNDADDRRRGGGGTGPPTRRKRTARPAPTSGRRVSV